MSDPLTAALYRSIATGLLLNVRHRDVGDIIHRAIVKVPAVFPVAAWPTLISLRNSI
jgi:hypothetical protein